MYTRLPIFYVMGEDHRAILNSICINPEDCSIREAKDKLQHFYDILCKDVNRAMVTVL